MKCIKKLVAVLLTAVMAMTLLTACGGSSGGSSNGINDKTNAMTKKINAELKNQGSSIQVTYDKTIEGTLKKVYAQYAENLKGISNPTTQQENKALEDALNTVEIKGRWSMGTKWFNGTDSDVEGVSKSIATSIKTSAEKYNRNYKKIGYVTLLDAAGRPRELWYMVKE